MIGAPSPALAVSPPVHVYVLHASIDNAHKEQLHTFLQPAVRNGVLTLLQDGAGDLQRAGLAAAEVVVVLLTAEYLADQDLERQLSAQEEAARARGQPLGLIPVKVGHGLYHLTRYHRCTCLPAAGQPISDCADRERVWSEIATAISAAAAARRADRPSVARSEGGGPAEAVSGGRPSAPQARGAGGDSGDPVGAAALSPSGRSGPRPWRAGAALLALALLGWAALALRWGPAPAPAPRAALGQADAAPPVDLRPAAEHPSGPTGMARIPERRFLMGSSAQQIEAEYERCRAANPSCQRRGFAIEGPAHAVTVPAFLLDRHEVTNEDFVAWLNQARGARGALDHGVHFFAGGGVRHEHGRHHVAEPARRKPVVRVSWGAARAYCAAQGKRLPTEAEWESAARGDPVRRYPFGAQEPACADANLDRQSRGAACRQRGAGPAEVGAHAGDTSQEGVQDLAGNVMEWVADPFHGGYDADPRRATTERVLRGGSFQTAVYYARATAREHAEQDAGYPDVGFRCARDP